MTKYNQRHGGPYDRGSADSYYQRRFRPHYFVAGTNTSTEVVEKNMTQEELDAYSAGYEENEAAGCFKDYS